MYTTRRSGFDRDDARLHYAQLQQRKCGMVRVGDRVVLSDHKDAQVYDVTEVYSVSNGTRLVATLTYVSEYGRLCNAGGVDVSSLMTPTDAQMANYKDVQPTS
jgi:hypothetical protein